MNCYLLIDANNFMFRCKLGHKLTHDIKRVEVIYSGFRNLIGLINKVANDNKDCSQVITAFCWDGGYTRRMEASIKSKEKGLIDLLYKEKRRIMRDAKKEVMTQEEELEDVVVSEQIDKYRELLDLTCVNQVFVKGEEADDIIATYVGRYSKDNKVVIVSSDRDYYQLLGDNVSILKNLKEYYTYDDFKKETGLDSSSKWVDVGSLCGDDGDSICAVPGFGEITALKFIKEFGFIDELFEKLKAKTKLSNKESNILLHEERIRSSYYLKGMFYDLEVPELTKRVSDSFKLEKTFENYRFFSLMKNINVLQHSDKPSRTIFSITNVMRDTFKCPKCNKEYSSSSLKMVECPECDNQKPYQPTLF